MWRRAVCAGLPGQQRPNILVLVKRCKQTTACSYAVRWLSAWCEVRPALFRVWFGRAHWREFIRSTSPS